MYNVVVVMVVVVVVAPTVVVVVVDVELQSVKFPFIGHVPLVFATQ